MIAEQTAHYLTYGGRIAAEIQEKLFDYLDHEVLVSTGGLASPVVSAPLNRAALGNADAIKATMTRLVA